MFFSQALECFQKCNNFYLVLAMLLSNSALLGKLYRLIVPRRTHFTRLVCECVPTQLLVYLWRYSLAIAITGQ